MLGRLLCEDKLKDMITRGQNSARGFGFKMYEKLSELVLLTLAHQDSKMTHY